MTTFYPNKTLRFGYHDGLPEGKTVAWGARAIFGGDYFIDLLWDRQDALGEGPELDRLFAWLNGEDGALRKARESKARYYLRPNERTEVVLYEDEVGIIKANTNASYGYLYMVAYLKE
jgi:hypothetical protein